MSQEVNLNEQREHPDDTRLKDDEADRFLKTLFSRAGKEYPGYGTPEERDLYKYSTGGHRFKREILGLCGKKATKSLDEIANVLVKINVANSLFEARQLVPQMVSANRRSHIYTGDQNYIRLDTVEGLDRDFKYRVTTGRYGV